MQAPGAIYAAYRNITKVKAASKIGNGTGKRARLARCFESRSIGLHLVPPTVPMNLAITRTFYNAARYCALEKRGKAVRTRKVDARFRSERVSASQSIRQRHSTAMPLIAQVL